MDSVHGCKVGGSWAVERKVFRQYKIVGNLRALLVYQVRDHMADCKIIKPSLQLELPLQLALFGHTA
jgi:hypothetical protein